MHVARRTAVALLLAAPLAAPAAAADTPQIDVEEFQLPNGMRWLLYQNHDSPVIFGGWVAHVGSVNERPGITGISHLFEHMMFKGTRTIGTRDIEADLKIIEAQEVLREQMRAEEAKLQQRLREGKIDEIGPDTWTDEYRALEEKFDALVEQQRETIIKDHLDQVYTRNGGERMNAGTTEDLTLYMIQVPRNRLELWCWLESDRLMNPVFREFYSERDVVYEERRLRTESTPLGKFDEAFNAMFWEAMPYSWPVVGWGSDLDAITKAQADAYFGVYYAPGNLTGVLAGDFDSAEARAMVERYFGRLAPASADPPPVVTREPELIAEKRYHAEAETSPTLRIWWQGVPFVHEDVAALDLLTDILSGRTGRLYKGLVEGRELANGAYASIDTKKYAGAIQVEVTLKDGGDPAAAEAAVDEELERLRTEPVPERELQKVKNQAKADSYRRLSSPFFIGIQLLFYDGLGDWRYINTSAAALEAVTVEDIQSAAQKYFDPEHRVVGVFLREEGGEGAAEDAELAALSPQAQGMARQVLSQIEAETDPEALRQGLGQMEQAAAQAPEEMKAAIELVLKRGRERIEALEAEAGGEGEPQ